VFVRRLNQGRDERIRSAGVPRAYPVVSKTRAMRRHFSATDMTVLMQLASHGWVDRQKEGMRRLSPRKG